MAKSPEALPSSRKKSGASFDSRGMQNAQALPTGAEYRRLREDAGLSRVALGRRAHVDPSTIFRLEKDDPEVSDRVRLLVAAALGLPVFSSAGAAVRSP